MIGSAVRKPGLFVVLPLVLVVIAGCSSPASVSSTPPVSQSNDYVSTNIGTLKYVPAGAYQRDGTPTNVSTVAAAFRMSEHEITVEQFVAVTGLANPSASFTSVVNGPVQNTNWYHAVVFCNKLSMAEGLTPVYTVGASTDPAVWITANAGVVPTTSNATWDAAAADWSANGYRLPTEMEWMWAAMGATSGSGYAGPTYLTGYGKLFAGSNSIMADGSGGSALLGDHAWYSVNSGSTTHPVGTTGAPANANELGLYDISGNVSEWCWDWNAAYPAGALSSDSAAGRGAASGTQRITRGGSWLTVAFVAAVAFRSPSTPYNQGNMIGFRVVRP